MILITGIDENNGMMFNKRRQSRDKILTKHICELANDAKIWVNNFSKEIFDEQNNNNVIVDDEFINKISKDEYCFIENISPSTLENKIDKIILYYWNRVYPADMYFDIKLEDWELESETEFAGSSHERITQKVFIRGKNNE